MGKNIYQPEQVIAKLREAEALLSKGKTIAAIVRQMGVNELSYYRWRKAYGGIRGNQALKLKGLEKENIQLTKLVADLSLDNAILKEAVRGNF